MQPVSRGLGGGEKPRGVAEPRALNLGTLTMISRCCLQG